MASSKEYIGSLGESVFAPYRQRVLFPVAAVAAAMFLPLAAYHMHRGDWALGGLLLVVVAMLAVDVTAIRRAAKPPIPFALLLLPAAAAVAISLMTQGLYGLLWAYPMALFAYFVLPRRFANATAASFGGMIAAMAFLEFGRGITLRFALSMALCILIVNIILDVLESLQRRLLAQSLTDPLTGAFNRRHMEASLAAAIERHGRTGAPTSIVLIDIDHFKSINDRFGHAAGDRVLVELVEIVGKRCRKLDVVFRMGGEEFLLLLPDTRKADAAALAEELRVAIATAPLLDGWTVTVSLGVSQLRGHDRVDDWLRRVDDALYGAKRGGRDQVAATSTRLPPGSRVVTSGELVP